MLLSLSVLWDSRLGNSRVLPAPLLRSAAPFWRCSINLITFLLLLKLNVWCRWTFWSVLGAGHSFSFVICLPHFVLSQQNVFHYFQMKKFVLAGAALICSWFIDYRRKITRSLIKWQSHNFSPNVRCLWPPDPVPLSPPLPCPRPPPSVA